MLFNPTTRWPEKTVQKEKSERELVYTCMIRYLQPRNVFHMYKLYHSFIIQYFLSEHLINYPCFRNFGQPFFPLPFVFSIFSCRQLKNANSFCSTRSTTANYSTVYSWHFVLEDTLSWSHLALFYLLSVHCYCHVTTIKTDQNIRREIPMFPNQGLFRVTMEKLNIV